MGSLAGAKQGAWLRVMTQAYVFVFSCSCSVFSLLLIKWEAERGDACSISWFIYTSVDVSAPLVLRRRLFDLLSLDDVQYLSAFLSSWAQSAASGRGLLFCRPFFLGPFFPSLRCGNYAFYL